MQGCFSPVPVIPAPSMSLSSTTCGVRLEASLRHSLARRDDQDPRGRPLDAEIERRFGDGCAHRVAHRKPRLHLLAEDMKRPSELLAGVVELRLGAHGDTTTSGLEQLLSGFAGGDDPESARHVESFLPREAE